MAERTINGQGFAARVPAGFTVVPPNPLAQLQAKAAAALGVPVPLTSYGLIPPGSHLPPMSPALVFLDELPLQIVPAFVQNMYQGLEDPFLAMMNARSLGLQQVTRTAPARSVQLPCGLAHLREFEGIAMPPTYSPVRFMVFLIPGATSAVKIVIGINLMRWTEFVGPCLALVGGINVSGGQPLDAQVVALVDKDHREQVEMNILDPFKHTRVPITTFPTSVQGDVIINIDRSIHVGGSIKGQGIALGEDIQVLQGHHTL